MKKTSLTHPLQIQAVQVPGCGGVIGMTLCPGKVQRSAQSGEWERDLDMDLEAIRAWGASDLVSLMEPHEFKAFKVEALPARVPEVVRHWVLPIPDGGVPDAEWEAQWERAGTELRNRLRAGGRIVIHCRGGLGRTGTVAARLLVEFGLEPEVAMARVREARPGAIENRAQEAYVRLCKPLEKASPRPYLPIDPGRASRFRGCLLGGATGDALGAPVEFMDLEAIHRKFGPGGIRGLDPSYGRLGAITDDTQMTLFTAEGVLRAHMRFLSKGISSMPGVVANAYQRWLLTQGRESACEVVGRDGWLFTHQELFSTRAPGNTCLSALMEKESPGFEGPAANGSKGCGGLMRVAPIGLYTASRGLQGEQAFEWGCQVASITHGHPTGQLPAGVFAFLVHALALGREIGEACREGMGLLKGRPHHSETLEAMDRALDLAENRPEGDEAIRDLGQGWVAEEALAIALYCALTARTFEEGVIRAVNITGDSDSTGSLTGNLMGAARGVHEIPERWLEPLELRACLTAMADDLATVNDWEFSESGSDGAKGPGDLGYWWGRYPGW